MTAGTPFPAANPLPSTRPGTNRKSRERQAAGPEGSTDCFPLSAGQKGIWFAEQYQTGTAMYNTRLCLRLRGPLAVPYLEQAINSVVERHETLRSRFWSADGVPVQSVMPFEPVRLRMCDFASLKEDIREKSAVEAAEEEAERPFDLAAGNLIRFALIRLGEEEHLFVCTAHHIVIDGWSIGILLREIAGSYNAATSGAATSTADLPVQYADYAVWQADWLQGPEAERQSNYWKTRLAGADFGFNMLTDRPHPARKTGGGGQIKLQIPEAVAKLCIQSARAKGITPFMVLYAAFRLALARHTDQSDILVAVPVAGRPHTRFESLIGFFAGIIFLRTPVDEDKTFSELVQSVRGELLDSLAHQYYPLSQLVEELQPTRDSGAGSLIRVQFALQNSLDQDLMLAKIESSTVTLPFRTSVADLELNIFRKQGGLECTLRYNTDLFNADTMERFLTHFANLLGEAMRHPAAAMAQLDMLPAAERSQIVKEWNATEAPYPAACVHDLIDGQAHRTPRASAVEFGEQRLNYRDLALRSTKLANCLRGLDVGPDSVVGICIERSLDLIVAVLAVLKTGATYLPLDPGFPAARLSYMVQDSGARTLIAGKDQLPLFGEYSGGILLAEDIDDLCRNEPARLQPANLSPETIAYIIYTSGSTGTPKGVMIPHRAVVNFIESMRREPGLEPGESILAVTTFSFDIAALEMFLPLIAGGTVVIADRESVIDGRKLAAIIAKRKIALLQATPATWRMMIDSGWTGNKRLKALCGGEAMPRALADQLLSRVGALWNMYGPTETTVWSSIARVQPGTGAVPAGRPIANTTLYILDERGRPVPPGVAGKLCIGGAGLARGYLNQPELTAEKFISNPLPECRGERIYNTGDIARYLAGGDIEWLGRADGQVKIRGHRIETGEIEAVLSKHENVREAVVVVQQRSEVNSQLVAWLLPPHAGPASPDEIRRYAGQHLPVYMVPAVFRFLDAFPMTLNGKIDRAALSRLSPEPQQGAQLRIMPETALETKLVRIFEDLFAVSPIGVNESFFDLGGHSLLATRLVDRIEKETGHSIPLMTLFEAPTIREIARRCEDGGSDAGASMIVKLRSGELADDPLFCIHWLDAKLVTFQQIASLLAPRTVYGLHPQAISRPEESVRSIEEMASMYVREILAAHPHGPYHLAGSCLGGVVAFEIAGQLHAAGHEVGLVLMIDAMMPGRTPYLHGRAGLVTLFDWYFGEFLLSPVAAIGRWLNESWNRARALTSRQTRLARHTGHLRRINMAAAEAYQPEPFPGRITMLMCSDSPFRSYEDARLAWSSVARGGFEVHVIPGNHSTMEQEPNIQVLAGCLQASLERTERFLQSRATHPGHSLSSAGTQLSAQRAGTENRLNGGSPQKMSTTSRTRRA